MNNTHPEELLDALRDGSLHADGRAALDEHARSCTACSLEMGVAAEAADGLAPRPDDDLKMGAMVGVAMAQFDPARAEASSGGSSSGTLQSLAIAAGVVTVVVLAMVTGGPNETPPVPEPAPASAPVERADPTPHPKAPPEATLAPRDIAEPEAEAEASDTHEEAAEPADRADPTKSGLTAAELLAQANAARRAKSYEKAARLYAQLGREFRGSDEEVLSRVTYGRVLLDHLGKSKVALRRFDGYLKARPSGTLAEEALMGRAKALGRLGRENEERAAWQALLDRFPNSAYAALAKQRLSD
jgi:TolA-binding protein